MPEIPAVSEAVPGFAAETWYGLMAPAGTPQQIILKLNAEIARFLRDDDRTLFEFLVLEGAQAGLIWATVLNKRQAYRKAFAGFDPVQVARFNKRKIDYMNGEKCDPLFFQIAKSARRN